MSNRDDFSFDDDDFSQFDDDLDFPEDDFPSAPDADFDSDLPSDFDTGDSGGRGPNRTFVILAAVLVIIFVLGLGAVVFLFIQGQGPTPTELTATAIVATNNAVQILANQTATQSSILGMTQTAEALRPTNTPTATATPQPPTFTPTPTVDLTLSAFAAFQTQTVEALTLQAQSLTQTAIALTANVTSTPTPSPTQPGGAIDTTSVALTATYLADLFNQGGGFASPTVEGGTGGQVISTALPDTGLFDDVAAGNSNSMGLIALAAFGLVGVIVISRRLRATSTK